MASNSKQATAIPDINRCFETARTALRSAIHRTHTGANTNTAVVAGQEIADTIPIVQTALKDCNTALTELQEELTTDPNAEQTLPERAFNAAQNNHGAGSIIDQIAGELGEEKVVVGQNPDIDARELEELLFDLQNALEQKHRSVRTVLHMV
ncbi:hypothetical protein [Salinibaculum rarum]|uniref:hypothetical protein n=1 Tax=Salinibaculum rarum TaxID=3058903 RepID=UPI00265E7FD3|nr:hypothetical protein [Salinibaculum sp. KK48]